MTQAVVDRLEVVEIDEQQRDSIPSDARSCDDRLQMIKETAPVRQLRQWIVIRKMPQFASAFGHARLELYLLTAHIGLGLLQLFSHVIERCREQVHLIDATARNASTDVASCKSAR